MFHFNWKCIFNLNMLLYNCNFQIKYLESVHGICKWICFTSKVQLSLWKRPYSLCRSLCNLPLVINILSSLTATRWWGSTRGRGKAVPVTSYKDPATDGVNSRAWETLQMSASHPWKTSVGCLRCMNHDLKIECGWCNSPMQWCNAKTFGRRIWGYKYSCSTPQPSVACDSL